MPIAKCDSCQMVKPIHPDSCLCEDCTEVEAAPSREAAYAEWLINQKYGRVVVSPTIGG